MPRIIKETIKLIPSKKSLKIYKKSNSQNYYCSFYIGRLNSKSGNKEQSLKTPNVKVALKEAIKTYDLVIANQQHQQLKIDFDKDIAMPFFKHRNKNIT